MATLILIGYLLAIAGLIELGRRADLKHWFITYVPRQRSILTHAGDYTEPRWKALLKKAIT